MGLKQGEKIEIISGKMKGSAELYAQAKEYIPGGVSANIKYFAPHPIVMEKAKGSKLYDVDGNEYIDYLLCYGALILGHGHAKVNEAVLRQLFLQGTSVFGTPHRLEVEMAQKLVELFPGIESVRFTNSGLEATMLAIRTALAYIGKPKIGKFEGHYHGGYDQVLLSVNPDLQEAGPQQSPYVVPESKGISDYYIENTIILPFNDLQATEDLLRQHRNELAAVILEPIQGGFIPADQDFISGLRKITEELNIVLIFDEVKTGFRLTVGGAQSIYHVKPDLTALGKVLGGGFPVGAVGGKKEIMETMSPNGGKDILTAGANAGGKSDVLFHSGTYNGHPTVLAAGMATIETLESQGEMDRLVAKTFLLRDKLESVYRKHAIPMQTIGFGTVFNIVLTDQKIKNYRDMKNADMVLRNKIDVELLKLGVYIKPLNRYSLSIVHTEEDIERTATAHDKAIQIVKENAEVESRHLSMDCRKNAGNE